MKICINKQISKALICLQIFCLTFPDVSFGDACPNYDLSTCTTNCKNYSTTLAKVLAVNCPIPPVGLKDPTITLSDGTTYTNYGDCVTKQTSLQNQFGSVGPNCDAVQEYQTASILTLTSASLFSATAIACGAACFFPLNVAAQTACSVGSGVGTAFDVASTIAIVKLDKNNQDQWTKIFSASAVTGGVQTAGSLTAKSAAKAAGRTVTEGAAEVDEAASEAIKDAEKKATEASKKQKVLSCAVFGVALVTAGLKWANYMLDCKAASNTCDTINKLSSDQTSGSFNANVTSTASGTPANSAQAAVVGITSSGSTAGGSQTGNIFGSGLSAAGFAGNLASAAASIGNSGLSNLVGDLPNASQIPQALQDQGTSLASLGTTLQSQSPFAAAAGALSGSPDAAAAIQGIEKLVNEGKVSINGEGTGTVSGGGAPTSSSGNASSSFGSFGSRSFASAGTNDHAAFEKHAPIEDFTESDIFHSNWNGTIFQLISFKLVKTKDRIQNLEWSTTLNRALSGLSNKSGPTQKKEN